MSTTLRDSFIERMKELENAAVRAIDDIQNKYVLDGIAPDDELVFRLCKEANMTFEEYERRLALKREIPHRIANGLTQWEKADEARAIAKAISAYKTETDEIIEGRHKGLRQLQSQHNLASSMAQEAREDAHWALRNVQSPKLRQRQDAVHNAISESKSLETDLSRLALEMRYTEELVTRGLFPNGGQATPDDVKRAKEDLEEFKRDHKEKSRRLELLKIQIPVMNDNCMRVAIGADEMPLPVDFRYSEIGSVIAVYKSETATGEGEPLTPGVSDTDAQAKQIQAETASRAAGTLPTRQKTKAAPKSSDVTDNDLEI